MASSGVTFGGISSGLDTTSIINAILSTDQNHITKQQQQQSEIQNKQAAYTQLSSLLSSIGSAGSALNSATSFQSITGSSSDATVASISATTSATSGTYSLHVNALAKANKVSTSPQTDTSSALSKTGTIAVNGKAIDVLASDSLQAIAQKINDAASGAVASLIDGGSGKSYLTVASTSTGLANKLSVADVSGTVLQSLGLIGSTDDIRETITNGATSLNFANQDKSISNMLGKDGLGSLTFSIKGTSVSIDTSTDTLQTVADKINGASITGVKASVRSVTDTSGNTTYKLDVTGAAASDFADTGHLMESLGVLRPAPQNELIAAQDASYTLDKVALTSASNTVTGAIPGATLTLLRTDTTDKTADTTITMTKDTSAIKSKIGALASAYNNFTAFVKQYASFDASTLDTGLLFGDSVVQQSEDQLSSLFFSTYNKSNKTYQSLASIGFSQDTDGNLQVDDTTLSTALANAPAEVAALFQSNGSSSVNGLSYVSSSTNTKSSTSTGYPISITQVATKQSFVAGKAQTGANTQSEKLTFNGALLGNTKYVLDIDVGSTLNDTINKINTDSKLKNLLFASIDNGALRIDSKRYGTVGNFTIASNYSSTTSNSGIGVGGEGTTVNGVDVAGTINGEAAYGSGQFLNGKSGNAKTDGLQIMYTGTATGNIGNFVFNKGSGGLVNDLMTMFTDSVSGVLTAANKSLQDQYDSLASDITDLTERMATKKNDLTQTFSKMESAIATAKQQASQMSAMTG